LNSRRQTFPDLIELLLDEVNDRDCIGAGLAANIEPYPFFALNHVPSVRLRESIFSPADIVYSDRRPIDIRDDDVAKLANSIHAPQRPHADFASAANDAPSRDFNVLILNGVLKLIDGNAVRIQFLRVGVKAYLARPSSAALSMSLSRTNVQVILADPSEVCELSSSRPLIVFTTCSMGRTT